MEEMILEKLEDIALQVKGVNQIIQETKEEIKEEFNIKLKEIKEEFNIKLEEIKEEFNIKLKETKDEIEKNVSNEIKDLCISIERVENDKHKRIVKKIEKHEKKTLEGIKNFERILVS